MKYKTIIYILITFFFINSIYSNEKVIKDNSVYLLYSSKRITSNSILEKFGNIYIVISHQNKVSMFDTDFKGSNILEFIKYGFIGSIKKFNYKSSNIFLQKILFIKKRKKIKITKLFKINLNTNQFNKIIRYFDLVKFNNSIHYYRYHHIHNNGVTIIRELINFALKGEVFSQLNLVSHTTLRDEVWKYTKNNLLIYFLFDYLSKDFKIRSNYNKIFTPNTLIRSLEKVRIASGTTTKPLIKYIKMDKSELNKNFNNDNQNIMNIINYIYIVIILVVSLSIYTRKSFITNNMHLYKNKFAIGIIFIGLVYFILGFNFFILELVKFIFNHPESILNNYFNQLLISLFDSILLIGGINMLFNTKRGILIIKYWVYYKTICIFILLIIMVLQISFGNIDHIYYNKKYLIIYTIVLIYLVKSSLKTFNYYMTILKQ